MGVAGSCDCERDQDVVSEVDYTSGAPEEVLSTPNVRTCTLQNKKRGTEDVCCEAAHREMDIYSADTSNRDSGLESARAREEALLSINHTTAPTASMNDVITGQMNQEEEASTNAGEYYAENETVGTPHSDVVSTCDVEAQIGEHEAARGADPECETELLMCTEHDPKSTSTVKVPDDMLQTSSDSAFVKYNMTSDTSTPDTPQDVLKSTNDITSAKRANSTTPGTKRVPVYVNMRRGSPKRTPGSSPAPTPPTTPLRSPQQSPREIVPQLQIRAEQQIPVMLETVTGAVVHRPIPPSHVAEEVAMRAATEMLAAEKAIAAVLTKSKECSTAAGTKGAISNVETKQPQEAEQNSTRIPEKSPKADTVNTPTKSSTSPSRRSVLNKQDRIQMERKMMQNHANMHAQLSKASLEEAVHSPEMLISADSMTDEEWKAIMTNLWSTRGSKWYTHDELKVEAKKLGVSKADLTCESRREELLALIASSPKNTPSRREQPIISPEDLEAEALKP